MDVLCGGDSSPAVGLRQEQSKFTPGSVGVHDAALVHNPVYAARRAYIQAK